MLLAGVHTGKDVVHGCFREVVERIIGNGFNLYIYMVYLVRNCHIYINLSIFGLNVHRYFRTFGKYIL